MTALDPVAEQDKGGFEVFGRGDLDVPLGKHAIDEPGIVVILRSVWRKAVAAGNDDYHADVLRAESLVGAG